MDIIPCTTDHLRAVGSPLADLPSLPETSWAAIVDGKVAACAGFVQIHPGCAEGWIAFASGAPKLAAARAVKRHFAIEARRWRRVQATASASWPDALRFAEWLGMTPEGLMRSYGVDGSDHIRYARIS